MKYTHFDDILPNHRTDFVMLYFAACQSLHELENAIRRTNNGNPAAPEIEAEITAIDIAGTVAYAIVESNNWHGARFSDMLLLLKDGNEWKILTKVYFTH